MFTEDPFGSLPHPLGDWVEWRSERCRRGRVLLTVVNHRDGRALHLRPEELDPARRELYAATLELLDGQGFTASGDPVSVPRHSLFVWRGADRFVRRSHAAGAHRLVGRRALIVQVLVALAGLVAFVVTVRAGPAELRARPSQIPAILLLGLAAVMVHEFGHALVTIHYGRTVRQAGFGLHLGSPAFYVESTDALLLDRRQRIVQAAAGPWAEWMFTSCVAIACLLVPRAWVGAPLLHRFAMVNTIGILSNLIPFVGLDGALIVSDVVREADLPFRSRTSFWRSSDRDWFVTTYSVLDALAATALMALAGFFWWELFGQLIIDLWASPPGKLVIAGCASLLAARIVRSARLRIGGIARDAYRWVRFRFQRTWRVRATLAFAKLPALAVLDEVELGVVAGLLHRRRIGKIDRPESRWAAAFVGRRGSAAVIPFVDGGPNLCCRRATLLPLGWQAFLDTDLQTRREPLGA